MSRVQYHLSQYQVPTVWAEAHGNTPLFHMYTHPTLMQGWTEGIEDSWHLLALSDVTDTLCPVLHDSDDSTAECRTAFLHLAINSRSPAIRAIKQETSKVFANGCCSASA